MVRKGMIGQWLKLNFLEGIILCNEPRCRPYLKTIYKKYLRNCIKKINKNIAKFGGIFIDKSLVNSIIGNPDMNSVYLKRSLKTEEIYRLIEISLHKIIRSCDNPPKLRD
jgi:hypothetical protein